MANAQLVAYVFVKALFRRGIMHETLVQTWT